jgi:hypothetical protein
MEAADGGFSLRRTIVPFLSGGEGGLVSGSPRKRQVECEEFIAVIMEHKNGCFGVTPLLNKLRYTVVYSKSTDFMGRNIVIVG